MPPIVPTQTQRSVLPEVSRTSGQRLSVPRNAFGAGQAQALQQLGTNVADVSRAFTVQTERMLKEQNEAFAMETKASFDTFENEQIVGELLQRKGKNASTVVDEGIGRLAEYRDEALKNARNPAQRRAIENIAANARGRVLSTLTRHQAKEQSSYASESFKATLETSKRLAYENYGNIEVINSAKADVIDAVEARGNTLGLSEVAINSLVDAELNELHKGVASNMVVAGFGAQALEYVSANASEMNPSDSLKLIRSITDNQKTLLDKADKLKYDDPVQSAENYIKIQGGQETSNTANGRARAVEIQYQNGLQPQQIRIFKNQQAKQFGQSFKTLQSQENALALFDQLDQAVEETFNALPERLKFNPGLGNTSGVSRGEMLQNTLEQIQDEAKLGPAFNMLMEPVLAAPENRTMFESFLWAAQNPDKASQLRKNIDKGFIGFEPGEFEIDRDRAKKMGIAIDDLTATVSNDIIGVNISQGGSVLDTVDVQQSIGNAVTVAAARELQNNPSLSPDDLVDVVKQRFEGTRTREYRRTSVDNYSVPLDKAEKLDDGFFDYLKEEYLGNVELPAAVEQSFGDEFREDMLNKKTLSWSQFGRNAVVLRYSGSGDIVYDKDTEQPISFTYDELDDLSDGYAVGARFGAFSSLRQQKNRETVYNTASDVYEATLAPVVRSLGGMLNGVADSIESAAQSFEQGRQVDPQRAQEFESFKGKVQGLKQEFKALELEAADRGLDTESETSPFYTLSQTLDRLSDIGSSALTPISRSAIRALDTVGDSIVDALKHIDQMRIDPEIQRQRADELREQRNSQALGGE